MVQSPCACAVYEERDRFGHRFHSCLTNVRREWRHCLRVDGRALYMSDVANSQPLVLASVLREKGVGGCDEYVRLCEEGRFYDQAAEELGVGRDDAKRNLVSYVFFGKNKYRSKYHTWLQERFPPVYEFIRTAKRTDYARLARMLQRQESKIVISGACDDMMLLEPDLFVATIHDALLYLPEDRETVEGRLREAFRRFGVRVTLKHTSYEERP